MTDAKADIAVEGANIRYSAALGAAADADSAGDANRVGNPHFAWWGRHSR